ncbi:hypothetical protein EJ08DRAFT_646630 [Tothia fuscella]|uniref:Uncharacterized protein n=1 Tax=Tothia fuscella TaxID=1048955 RepID=A0A9P4U2Q4_9PEZI|nr:hypothetical protein EJ08DRAFT_646630 [Tothia fuscella]
MWDYEFPVPRACFHSSGLEGDENMLVMHLLITNNKWYLYGFTFSHLQLAMGRHFGGASQGIPLSELSLSTGYEVARRRGFIFRRSMDADEKVYEKHDIRAAIFEDKLYIHHRQSFSFEKNLADLAEWWINRGRNSLTMNVCKHVGYAPNLLTSYDTLRDTVLDLLWREEVTHKENERHPRNCFRKIAGVKSCDSCFTEYQITLVGLGPEKIEIILDAWHMLGRGRKLEDPIWQAMCGEKKSEDDGDLKDTPIMRERVPGSLKAVFENGNAIFDNRSPTEIIRDDEITRLASEEAPNDTSQEIRKKKTSKFTNRRRKAGQQHHTMGEEQAATLNGGEFSGDLNAHNQGRRSEAGADELVVQWERKPLKPKRD